VLAEDPGYIGEGVRVAAVEEVEHHEQTLVQIVRCTAYSRAWSCSARWEDCIQ
jgi:hypothetical protein